MAEPASVLREGLLHDVAVLADVPEDVARRVPDALRAHGVLADSRRARTHPMLEQAVYRRLAPSRRAAMHAAPRSCSWRAVRSPTAWRRTRCAVSRARTSRRRPDAVLDR